MQQILKKKLGENLDSVWQKKTEPWGGASEAGGQSRHTQYESTGPKLMVPVLCGCFDSGAGCTVRVQTREHDSVLKGRLIVQCL